MNKSSSITVIQKKISWEEINKKYLNSLLQLCLEEEVTKNHFQCPSQGDISTRSSNVSGTAHANIVTREKIVCSGLNIYPHIFEVFGARNLTFLKLCEDGETASTNSIIAKIEGDISEILLIERTLLNFIQRLSGIATFTESIVQKIERYNVNLLDTRKTTPGMRYLEKYATGCGGSYNHRLGLHDRILIKDNHLASRNIKNKSDLISFAKEVRRKSPNTFIEIEVDSIEFALALTSNEVNAVLLDNFNLEDVVHVRKKIDQEVIIEVSGGISSSNIGDYASCRPDFISTGAPTHSSRWVDIGLDWY